ncbi:MAG: hypothetical protein V7636_529, partial [Actinomycetota bacterium]
SAVPSHGTTTRVRQKTGENWSGRGSEGLPKVWVL